MGLQADPAGRTRDPAQGAAGLPLAAAPSPLCPKRLSWAQPGWATGPHLHLRLDPGPHDVGLAGELAAEALVGLLLALLLQERVVPLGHQLLHLGGRGGNNGGQVVAPRPASPTPAPPPSPPTFSHLELMICGVTVV